MYVTHTPCKNKYIKGSLKRFLCNNCRGLVKPYYLKKLLGKKPTVLVTEVHRGEKPPRLRVTPRRVTVYGNCRKLNADHLKDEFNYH